MRDTVIAIVGGLVAVVLQIIIAPNIAIFSAMPNFVLAYTGIVAMLCRENRIIVLAFVLGLAYDLLGSNPVGLMAGLCVVVAFVAGKAYDMFGNDTVFVPLAVSMVCSLIVELVYALALLGFGLEASLADAVLLRALPCAFYDAAMALIVFPVLSIFLKPTARTPKGPSQTTVRLR